MGWECLAFLDTPNNTFYFVMTISYAYAAENITEYCAFYSFALEMIFTKGCTSDLHLR